MRAKPFSRKREKAQRTEYERSEGECKSQLQVEVLAVETQQALHNAYAQETGEVQQLILAILRRRNR